MEFDNLHLTDNLSNAVKSIKGSSGIYCIRNKDTGQMYIGSSVDLGARLADHFGKWQFKCALAVCSG
jgi:excinuclease UvrABC nuclease subunit